MCYNLQPVCDYSIGFLSTEKYSSLCVLATRQESRRHFGRLAHGVDRAIIHFRTGILAVDFANTSNRTKYS